MHRTTWYVVASSQPYVFKAQREHMLSVLLWRQIRQHVFMLCLGAYVRKPRTCLMPQAEAAADDALDMAPCQRVNRFLIAVPSWVLVISRTPRWPRQGTALCWGEFLGVLYMPSLATAMAYTLAVQYLAKYEKACVHAGPR